MNIRPKYFFVEGYASDLSCLIHGSCSASMGGGTLTGADSSIFDSTC